ncbi:MAG: GxxExxY protein [Planctomycetota bacterium]
MAELLYEEETYAIRGAAIEVHKRLGPGFLEAVYQEALQIELSFREIPFESQKALRISYRDQTLAKAYIADLVCYETIILELKCVSRITDRDRAQLINYLTATGLQVGLIINFGSRGRLEIERLVR